MTPQKKSVRETTDKIKWWRKKKGAKKNKIPPKFDNFLVNELVSDPQIRQNELNSWVSPTQMGMDKIRASTNVGKYFVDFASSATVHGLNHLAAPHRHPVERFLAVVFIGAAITGLILLSVNFWNRYQNEATIFILERNFRFYNATSPAVLLCPITRINVTMFPDVFERHGIEDTREAREFFTFLANATYLNMDKIPSYTKVQPEKWLTIIWELKNDPEAGNPDDDSVGTWIVTERGICQLFYSNVAEYSSYTYWMQNNWTIVPQPAKVAGFSFKAREIGRTLKVMYDSVQVSAYNPQEVPEFEKLGMYAPQREMSKLKFIPQEITSSTEVKNLSPSQRKCKILSEGGLTMWPVYTHNMCIIECKYGLMRKRCGCHPFFARPMPGIPVCDVSQLRCIAEHRSEFIKMNASVAHSSCGCYHNCDTSSYEEKENTRTTLKVGSPNDTICKIYIDFPMQKIRRELLFGFNDFMASVGGAAGLLIGGSVISFAEFFYWATLRLYWYRINVRREKEAKLKLRKTFYDKMTKGASDKLNPSKILKISSYNDHHELENKKSALTVSELWK